MTSARPHKRDPVKVHVESYPYNPGENYPRNKMLVDHMRYEHREDYYRWSTGATIGDLQDQHYIAHGLPSGETMKPGSS